MNAALPRPPMRADQIGPLSMLPLNEYLTVRIAESGKTNVEIAQLLGYGRPNVVSMLKTGSMRLPVNKVSALARVLNIDPVFLLEKVLTESSPEVWDCLKGVIGNYLVTANECSLIDLCRKELNGVDANVVGFKEFTDVIVPALHAIAKYEHAVSNTTLPPSSASLGQPETLSATANFNAASTSRGSRLTKERAE